MSKLHWREKMVKSCPPGPPDCPVDHLVGPPGPVDHLVGPPGPVDHLLCENFPLGRKSSLESFQTKTFTKNSLGHSYVRMQQGCTNMRLTGEKNHLSSFLNSSFWNIPNWIYYIHCIPQSRCKTTIIILHLKSWTFHHPHHHPHPKHHHHHPQHHPNPYSWELVHIRRVGGGLTKTRKPTYSTANDPN